VLVTLPTILNLIGTIPDTFSKALSAAVVNSTTGFKPVMAILSKAD